MPFQTETDVVWGNTVSSVIKHVTWAVMGAAAVVAFPISCSYADAERAKARAQVRIECLKQNSAQECRKLY